MCAAELPGFSDRYSSEWTGDNMKNTAGYANLQTALC